MLDYKLFASHAIQGVKPDNLICKKFWNLWFILMCKIVKPNNDTMDLSILTSSYHMMQWKRNPHDRQQTSMGIEKLHSQEY